MKIQVIRSELKVVLTLNELEARAIRKLIGNTSGDQRVKELGCSQVESKALSAVFDILYQEEALV